MAPVFLWLLSIAVNWAEKYIAFLKMIDIPRSKRSVVEFQLEPITSLRGIPAIEYRSAAFRTTLFASFDVHYPLVSGVEVSCVSVR